MIIKDFNVKDILLSVLGYKGLPYPGVWFPDVKRDKQGDDYNYTGEYQDEYQDEQLYTKKGTLLRKKDAQGRYYFMPAVFQYTDSANKPQSVEIPNALISFTGKKTIVETPMVGRKGTVKELISVDDYEISVQSIAQANDFPEAALVQLNELYNINKSITFKCALTDLFLEDDDKVVIKSIELSDMKGTDTAQSFNMKLITDRSFELKIE